MLPLLSTKNLFCFQAVKSCIQLHKTDLIYVVQLVKEKKKRFIKQAENVPTCVLGSCFAQGSKLIQGSSSLSFPVQVHSIAASYPGQKQKMARNSLSRMSSGISRTHSVEISSDRRLLELELLLLKSKLELDRQLLDIFSDVPLELPVVAEVSYAPGDKGWIGVSWTKGVNSIAMLYAGVGRGADSVRFQKKI